MLLPKPNSVEFESIPAGTYAARCYRFIDLGTQPKTFKGETKLVRQIRLSWELPLELMTKGDHSGKPFSLHNTYTWSMSEKAMLRKTLESWRGKKFSDADFGAGGFDTHKLLGVPCMLGVSTTEKDGKTYTNISSVSPLLKGFAMPEAVNPQLYFSFDMLAGLAPDVARKAMDEVFSKLSKNTVEMLSRTPEYAAATGHRPEHDDDNESYGHANQVIPDDSFSESIPF